MNQHVSTCTPAKHVSKAHTVCSLQLYVHRQASLHCFHAGSTDEITGGAVHFAKLKRLVQAAYLLKRYRKYQKALPEAEAALEKLLLEMDKTRELERQALVVQFKRDLKALAESECRYLGYRHVTYGTCFWLPCLYTYCMAPAPGVWWGVLATLPPSGPSGGVLGLLLSSIGGERCFKSIETLQDIS